MNNTLKPSTIAQRLRALWNSGQPITLISADRAAVRRRLEKRRPRNVQWVFGQEWSWQPDEEPADIPKKMSPRSHRRCL